MNYHRHQNSKFLSWSWSQTNMDLKQNRENSSQFLFYRYLISYSFTVLLTLLSYKSHLYFVSKMYCYNLMSAYLSIPGRFNITTRKLRKCIYCNISNEYNMDISKMNFSFIMVCLLYHIFHKKYFKPYFWRRHSIFKLAQLVSLKKLKL